MKNRFYKSILPCILSILTMLGAFSLKIEYDRGQTQEKIGKLVVSLSKSCNK